MNGGGGCRDEMREDRGALASCHLIGVEPHVSGAELALRLSLHRMAGSRAASAVCRWMHEVATRHKSGGVLHGGRFAVLLHRIFPPHKEGLMQL